MTRFLNNHREWTDNRAIMTQLQKHSKILLREEMSDSVNKLFSRNFVPLLLRSIILSTSKVEMLSKDASSTLVKEHKV